jgi:hypothetical protein
MKLSLHHAVGMYAVGVLECLNGAVLAFMQLDLCSWNLRLLEWSCACIHAVGFMLLEF